jgi:hypothetical protein
MARCDQLHDCTLNKFLLKLSGMSSKAKRPLLSSTTEQCSRKGGVPKDVPKDVQNLRELRPQDSGPREIEWCSHAIAHGYAILLASMQQWSSK